MNNQRNAPAHIHLHIERLVLDGGPYTGAQLAQLRSGMERELTSLMHARGLPTQGRTEIAARGYLPAPQANQTPDQLGRDLARGLYASLNPGWEARP